MAMPIQFDTAQYMQRLLDAGIPYEQALAFSEALQQALSQPVANDTDFAIFRAEMRALLAESEARLEARFEARLDAKLRAELRPLWVMNFITMIGTAAMATRMFL